MLNQIKDIIHHKTGIYSSLWFSTEDKIKDYDFNFSFPISLTEEQDLESDVNIFLDNIIAKIFELNFDVDYNSTSISQLGNSTIYDDIEYKNFFIIGKYNIEKDYKILDLENCINDLKIENDINRYTLKIKLPIYKLDKTKVSLL